MFADQRPPHHCVVSSMDAKFFFFQMRSDVIDYSGPCILIWPYCAYCRLFCVYLFVIIFHFLPRKKLPSNHHGQQISLVGGTRKNKTRSSCTTKCERFGKWITIWTYRLKYYIHSSITATRNVYATGSVGGLRGRWMGRLSPESSALFEVSQFYNNILKWYII